MVTAKGRAQADGCEGEVQGSRHLIYHGRATD